MDERTIGFSNGRVYTSAHDRGAHDAIVFRHGRVAWVGARADAPQSIDWIDLQGGTVVPGLTDAHVHLYAVAHGRLQIDAGGATSIDDLLETLRRRAAAPGGWLVAANYDEGRLCEGRHPTRAELDAAVPDLPVVLRRFCGHVAVLNSAALRRVDVDEAVADPSAGMFGRDAGGRLDGAAFEAAAELIFRRMPAPSQAAVRDALRGVLDDCVRLGLTAAVEAAVGFTDGFDEEHAVWRSLRETSPRLPLRLGFMHQLGAAEAARRGLVPTLDDDWQSATLKFFADGIVGARTAAVGRPFADTGTHGLFMTSEAELEGEIVAAHRAGWQIAVHAVGDRAVSRVLDDFALADRLESRSDTRHRLEHVFCPPEGCFERMRALGAAVVMQPSFLVKMHRSIQAAFGADVGGHYPGRSALAADVAYAGSSDAPTGILSPWHGMAASIDRGGSAGAPIGPGEALTAPQALAAYTRGGAYVMKQETWRGGLEPGMAADAIVLDRDPLRSTTAALRDTRVLLTMVRGVVHHDELQGHADMPASRTG